MTGSQIQEGTHIVGQDNHTFDIIHLAPAEVPEKVMEWFERRSNMYVRDYKPGNWLSFGRVEMSDGTTIWIASQIKHYGEKAGSEHLHHLLEMQGCDNAGHAELRFNLDQNRAYFSGKPFVGFTHTEQLFRRTGRGLRRLLLMNQLAIYSHGFPIASDTVIDDTAARIWERLVTAGLAREFQEGQHRRWQMVGGATKAMSASNSEATNTFFRASLPLRFNIACQ